MASFDIERANDATATGLTLEVEGGQGDIKQMLSCDSLGARWLLLRLDVLSHMVLRQTLGQRQMAEFVFALRAAVLSPNLAFKPRRVTSPFSLPSVEIKGGLCRLSQPRPVACAIQAPPRFGLGADYRIIKCCWGRVGNERLGWCTAGLLVAEAVVVVMYNFFIGRGILV